jgi:hypothetical protein
MQQQLEFSMQYPSPALIVCLAAAQHSFLDDFLSQLLNSALLPAPALLHIPRLNLPVSDKLRLLAFAAQPLLQPG